jgi:hypothetical protein
MLNRPHHDTSHTTSTCTRYLTTDALIKIAFEELMSKTGHITTTARSHTLSQMGSFAVRAGSGCAASSTQQDRSFPMTPRRGDASLLQYPITARTLARVLTWKLFGARTTQPATCHDEMMMMMQAK